MCNEQKEAYQEIKRIVEARGRKIDAIANGVIVGIVAFVLSWLLAVGANSWVSAAKNSLVCQAGERKVFLSGDSWKTIRVRGSEEEYVLSSATNEVFLARDCLPVAPEPEEEALVCQAGGQRVFLPKGSWKRLKVQGKEEEIILSEKGEAYLAKDCFPVEER